MGKRRAFASKPGWGFSRHFFVCLPRSVWARLLGTAHVCGVRAEDHLQGPLARRDTVADSPTGGRPSGSAGVGAAETCQGACFWTFCPSVFAWSESPAPLGLVVSDIQPQSSLFVDRRLVAAI